MRTTLQKLTVVWPLAIFLLLPVLTRAETAVQAWVQRYSGPGISSDCAYAVAMDSSNSVVVTGYSYAGASGSDYATVKYSNTGVPLWTNRYRGPGSGGNQALAVGVDGSNNVIVVGNAPGSGGYLDYGCATLKYSSTGVPLWTNYYHGLTVGYNCASTVGVDGSNNVIVDGGADGDYATLKYSSAGVPLWTNFYNGPGNNDDTPTAVTVDGNGNVIVTGYSMGSTSSYFYDYATLKYSSAGVPLWTNRYNGTLNGYDQANAVAVDGSGNVIVTGRSAGSGSFYDYATLKYSSAGMLLWTKRYNGPAKGYAEACAVAVDSSNNVIVTGYFTNSTSGYDCATIKYSSAGVPLWTNRYNGPGSGDDQAHTVALDGSGNVIVTGFSMNNASGYDYVTIKYSSAGLPLWTNRYNGPGNSTDQAWAVAVDRNGNVIVAGASIGSGGYSDFATIKYICVPEPVLTAIQLTNGTFQMRVDGMLQPGTLVIEACPNLSTTNWAGVFTNTTPTNVLFYADPDAGNAPTRFYRAFQFP